MKDRIYKAVVLLSFLILIFVQLSLTYNTYVLKDREYSLKEKKLLNDEYGRSIYDDKVYKGGGKIIDSVLAENMPALKDAFFSNKLVFKTLSEKVSKSILTNLRRKSSMDSVFNAIVKVKGLDTNLRYLLTFESIQINFGKGLNDIDIFDIKHDNLFKQDQKTPFGFIIDGTLTNPDSRNRVTNLSVSGKLVYDYRITFNFFVDAPGRPLKIAYQMLPTFSLVALCIIIIVGINYYTYINWMRQKKETDVKSDFLNSIKHEFNTPITTILVASKSLDEDEVLQDRFRVKALVNVVERQARRLQSHINQMLEVSEIDKNIHLEETDLNYMVLTIVNDYKIKVKAPNSITFDPLDDEILMTIDTFAFTSMLQNMLDNAFKHNDSAIRITDLYFTQNDDSYIFHIRDNGKGVDDLVKDKIFEKFFRANQQTSIPGLGLGLYYVRQCLEIHGWGIHLETEIEKGNEFLIYMPKQQMINGGNITLKT